MGNSPDKRGWRNTLTRWALISFIAIGAGQAVAEAPCAPDTVMLRGDWGSTRFTVEIADDPREHAKGLMHRESMATSVGMLFIYDTSRSLSFWMRNTLIPLDMLFIDATGVVRHIHHEAVPLDETPIFGGNNLKSVLEINGGLARRLGITTGTQVRHPSFAGANPVWPCQG